MELKLFYLFLTCRVVLINRPIYFQVIKMAMNMAFKNSYNLMVRLNEEQLKHNHIFARKKEADSVTKALREQRASEEQIAEMVCYWILSLYSIGSLSTFSLLTGTSREVCQTHALLLIIVIISILIKMKSYHKIALVLSLLYKSYYDMIYILSAEFIYLIKLHALNRIWWKLKLSRK